ncbi:MAG TPA: hypothetical protein VGI29_11215 [Candidatus Binataceae bacterium]
MYLRRDHLGTRFEVRTDRWTWFWRLVDPPFHRAAAGAAATEADAVSEACTAIEEISARSGAAAQSMCSAAAPCDSSFAPKTNQGVPDARRDRMAVCPCTCR